MSLSDNQIKILRHSLGLDIHGHGKMYREHYCQPIDFESQTLTDIRDMIARGLMIEGNKINDGRDQYFLVTEAGKKAAVESVEAIKA